MSYSSFAKVYDALTKNVGYEKIAERICSLLRENGVGKGLLLDNACGTGTLSVLLSKAGYDVIAADKSAEMLSAAMEKNAEENAGILFLNQSMTGLDLYGTIKACVCTLDSINHLENFDEVTAAFEKVSLFTEKDGVFIFDVNTLYKHKKVLENNIFIYDEKDIYCVWQNELDGDSVNISLDFFTKDKSGEVIRTNEFFTETAYELEEIEKALEKAGFSVINIFDDYTDSPVTDTTERAVFVCKKEK
ncbi:MAG: class I SAM-dependent methyltransferase [Clostridia bacterium]|nr:class I SAM-dependent methyltransferase [Clostridia bacterium]